VGAKWVLVLQSKVVGATGLVGFVGVRVGVASVGVRVGVAHWAR